MPTGLELSPVGLSKEFIPRSEIARNVYNAMKREITVSRIQNLIVGGFILGEGISLGLRGYTTLHPEMRDVILAKVFSISPDVVGQSIAQSPELVKQYLSLVEQNPMYVAASNIIIESGMVAIGITFLKEANFNPVRAYKLFLQDAKNVIRQGVNSAGSFMNRISK